MPRLIVSFDRKVKAEYKIEKVRTVVGRGTNCDIRLDDVAASTRHAEVVTVGNDAFIHDLGSTNGTYVNNLLTKRCVLNDGDLIGVGSHVLTFHTEQFADTVPDFEKTMVIQTGLRQHAKQLDAEMTAIETAEAKEKDAAVKEDKAQAAIGRLEVLNGALIGRMLELRKPILTLGRPGIQAAVISRRTDGYYLTHVAGAGGGQSYPLVNSKPTGPTACPLKDKDIIELAGVRMEFRLI